MMKRIFCLNLLISLFFLGCQDVVKILQQANIAPPVVRINDVKLTNMNLENIDLKFTLGIENQNSISVELAGFDYELLIENKPFVKGEKQDALKIASNGRSEFSIPVSVNYTQLYEIFQAVKKADSIHYTFKSNLFFLIPFLGKIRVPVETTQTLPKIRLPIFKASKLKIDALDFAGADLSLFLEMENPNTWDMVLQNLDYSFAVNGQEWIAGKLNKKIALSQKGRGVIEIPMHLDFLKMGQSAYLLIKNPADLEYSLTGNATIKSSISLLESFNIPLNQKGRISIEK